MAAQRPFKLFRNFSAKIASIPMVTVALVIFVGCTLWTVVYSFTSSGMLPKALFEWSDVPLLPFDLPTGIRWSSWVGLAQYERLWSTPRWINSIGNLAIFGVLSMAFTLVIGFVLAALLDRKVRGEDVFRTIFLYPFALSFIVTGLIWQWILNPDFGIQHVVRSMGWETFTFNPIYDANIVLYGLLIAALWQGTGLIMCIMLAGLRGIDEDIWKAARVDGIATWKTYTHVIIPMMRPVFVTALVLIASGIIKVYDLVIAQTSGGPGLASDMPAIYVMQQLFGAQNLGQGFAASTMMLLSVVIILIPWAILEYGGKKRG